MSYLNDVENIVIDGNYSGICYAYRNNPNPVVKGGCVFNYFFSRPERQRMSSRSYLFSWLNSIFGDFYHIDPMSIFTIESPAIYGTLVRFKAKSIIKPIAQEREDQYYQCHDYWVNSLMQ